MSYKGVDVSQHNGSIDWVKLSKEIDFAIIRLGWVGNKNNHTIDTKFETNYKNAKANGVKIGVYVYNYCASEDAAISGAKWTVENLKGKTLDLPVYFDMEDKSIVGLGKSKLTAVTKAFNSVIESSGFWAGIYANRNWFDNYLEDGIEKRYTSWIAHYTSGTDKYKGEFDIWQNSSTGKVNGISGNVDTNYMYRDLISEVKGKRTATTATKPVITVKKSVTEIAKEVINGKWGNGDDRKNRITKAGYDYDKVQKKVNELLKISSSQAKKSVDQIAREVIAGKWGNGQDRKNRLTKAGYDYNIVQKRVNQLI